MLSSDKNPNAVIASFLAHEVGPNQWLKCQHLSFYVRRGPHRHVRGGKTFFKPCLQVANWNLITRGRHCFRTRKYSYAQVRQLYDFMVEIERAVVREGYLGVFVELVYSAVLRRHLSLNGYEVVHGKGTASPSYFKPTSTILKQSKWVEESRLGAQKRPRVTMSAFVRDSTISRHWVWLEERGLYVRLQRDWCRGRSIAPRLRLTVLDIMRASSDNLTGQGPSLYMGDDRAELQFVLEEVQRRVTSASEIALSCDAFWWGSKSGGSLHVHHQAQAQWLLDLGYSLETHDRLRDGMADRYVKRIG